jgi:hypothetical protein
MRRKATRRRKSISKPYTSGELNKIIDSLCHPLSKTNKGFILVDGLLHGIIEQNPPVTIKKFIRYNLPTIIKQLQKEAEKQRKENSNPYV